MLYTVHYNVNYIVRYCTTNWRSGQTSETETLNASHIKRVLFFRRVLTCQFGCSSLIFTLLVSTKNIANIMHN